MNYEIPQKDIAIEDSMTEDLLHTVEERMKLLHEEYNAALDSGNGKLANELEKQRRTLSGRIAKLHADWVQGWWN